MTRYEETYLSTVLLLYVLEIFILFTHGTTCICFSNKLSGILLIIVCDHLLRINVFLNIIQSTQDTHRICLQSLNRYDSFDLFSVAYGTICSIFSAECL